jgi:hypothetical protein
MEIGASYWIKDVIWRGHKMAANGVAEARKIEPLV